MTTKPSRHIFDFPWHLPLATLLPVISLYASNLGEFSPNVIVIPALFCSLCAVLLLIELRLRYRDWIKASIAVAILFYAAFNYGHFRDLIETGFSLNVIKIEPLLLYIMVVTTLSILFWIARHDIRILNQLLNVFFISAMLLSIWKIITFHLQHINTANRITFTDTKVTGQQLPDIYYIILDAYPRADVLLEVYGIDNSTFLSELEERGFYVADCALSNYPKTVLHFASTLNMKYLDFSIIKEPSISELGYRELYPYFTPQIENNQLISILKSNGYKIYQTATIYNFLKLKNIDKYFQPLDYQAYNFNLHLLKGLPIIFIPDRVWSYSMNQADNVFYVLETLRNISTLQGPKFIITHLAVPHGPHIFTKNGSITQNTETYPENSVEYIQGLENQLLFIKSRILKVIDVIQANKSNPAIIVIQSDHGQYTLRTEKWIRTTPWENTVPILNAIYYPDQNYNHIYNSITPVNTFRIILDKYLGTNIGLLPDISYDFGFPVDYAHPILHSESWSGCREKNKSPMRLPIKN